VLQSGDSSRSGRVEAAQFSARSSDIFVWRAPQHKTKCTSTGQLSHAQACHSSEVDSMRSCRVNSRTLVNIRPWRRLTIGKPSKIHFLGRSIVLSGITVISTFKYATGWRHREFSRARIGATVIFKQESRTNLGRHASNALQKIASYVSQS
jgi:hypothetical protein